MIQRFQVKIPMGLLVDGNRLVLKLLGKLMGHNSQFLFEKGKIW